MNKIKIQVGNVSCKVIDADPMLTRNLADVLSVMADNYWFSPKYKNGYWDGKISFMDRRSNTFPTGLLDKVLDYFEEYNLPYDLEDVREDVSTFKLDKIDYNYTAVDRVARDYQVDSVNAVLENKFEGLFFPRGIINLATNAGKTFVASILLKEIYPKLIEHDKIFLFVTHSKEIANQARESISNVLGEDVGMLGTGEWDVKPVTVALIPTLYRRREKKDFIELTDKIIGYIADECHHAKSDSFYKVFNMFNNAIYRIGLTGTAKQKSSVNQTKLICSTGKVLIRISNDYLINQGFSAKPKCVFLKQEKLNFGTLDYQEAYNKCIVNNVDRAKLTSTICKRETSEGNRVLILVEYIEHALTILDNLNIGDDKVVEFTHGNLSDKERARIIEDLAKGKIDILVSTSILDEGVDVSGINAIIYARGMKSTRKLLQGLGRGLRVKKDGSNVRYYDFIDDSNPKLLKHSRERYKILKDEKFSLKVMDENEYMNTDLENI